MAFILKYNSWKFIFALLFNTILSFISGLFFVWWSIVLVSFCVHFIFKVRPWPAFFSAFFSLFFLWTGLTVYISLYDNFYVSKLISHLFLGYSLPWLFNILTGILAGVLCGFSALCAAHARRIIGIKNPDVEVLQQPVNIPEHTAPVLVVEKEQNVPSVPDAYIAETQKEEHKDTQTQTPKPFNNNSFIVKNP